MAMALRDELATDVCTAIYMCVRLAVGQIDSELKTSSHGLGLDSGLSLMAPHSAWLPLKPSNFRDARRTPPEAIGRRNRRSPLTGGPGRPTTDRWAGCHGWRGADRRKAGGDRARRDVFRINPSIFRSDWAAEWLYMYVRSRKHGSTDRHLYKKPSCR